MKHLFQEGQGCNLSRKEGPLSVLVTGGLQGIGRSIAEKFLAQGDFVFVFDYVSPDDEKVLELKSLGIHYFCVDISSCESIKKGFEQFRLLLDEKESRLNVLVNNAGIARDMLAVRMSESYWDDVMAVNLKGAFFCSQQAITHMMRNGGGYVINISSVVGLVGNPGQANYAASKAGLIGVTKTLAKEYASKNILVNAIAPGFIKTSMTEKLSKNVQENILKMVPLKRFGSPEEIANLIFFLTSGFADYITGQVIQVDGGMVI